MIWRDIEGFEGFYQVSDTGQIRNTRTGSLKKPQYNWRGYQRVCLYRNGQGQSVFVHRLVAGAFLKNYQNKPQVNHINNVRDDNRVANLEWVTPSENMRHARYKGQLARGERNGFSKITSSDVSKIRNLHAAGESTVSIAKKFNISQSHASDVICRRYWRHV